MSAEPKLCACGAPLAAAATMCARCRYIARLVRVWRPGDRCRVMPELHAIAYFLPRALDVGPSDRGTVRVVTRAAVLEVEWDGHEGTFATSPESVDPIPVGIEENGGR
jgi:hypothetical protein